MPKEYVHVRDSYVARGVDYDEAQRRAAAAYNAKHPGHPMGSGEEYDRAKKAKKAKGGRDSARVKMKEKGKKK